MLFGGDMQQMVTPDGRRITVPSQLAQAFPGLQPFVPPEVAQPPDLPAAPAFTPQPSDALMPLEQPQQPSAPRPVQPEPAPAPQPQQSVVKPVTNAELAKMGPAGAANVELEAQNSQRAAVERQGEALANQATAVGEHMVKVNEEADRLVRERQQYAEQRAAELQSATDALTHEAKSISEVRVDRSVDHPVLAALSAALIGVGQAMNKQPIDAMGAVYKAIDRKVAAQMAELDNRRANYGMQKDALGMQRQAGRDRLDEMDAHRLAYLDQARRQLEEIKQKTSSDVIRGNTAVLQAELDAKAAQTISGAQQRFEQRQAQKEALAEQRAARQQSASQFQQTFKENQRQFDATLEERQRERDMLAKEKMDAIAAQLLASGQKERAEKIKANSAQAIGDPTNGESLLQPEGQALTKQADKLDKNIAKLRTAAAKEQDAGKRQALLTRADAEAKKALDLRASAAADHVWQVPDEKARGDIRTQISAGQTIASTVGEINLLREKHGPKWFVTTEGEARMQSLGATLQAALKEAWGLGVLSAADFQFLNTATGGDPTKITPGDVIKGLGVEGNHSRLNALVDNAEMSLRNKMGVLRYRGEFKLRRDETADRTAEEKAAIEALRSKTPSEAAASRPFGVIGAVADAASGGELSRKIEGGGSVSHPGLSKLQAGVVDAQLKAYRAGQTSEDEKAQKRSESAATLLVKLATDDSRPSMRDAMLTTLQANAPDLYEQALAKSSEDVRRTRTPQPGMPKRTAASLSDEERAEFQARQAQRDEEAWSAAVKKLMAERGLSFHAAANEVGQREGFTARQSR